MTVPVKLIDVGVEYGSLATIQHWAKRDGDTVTEGELLLSVESAKATADVVAPASGRLRIVAPEGAEWDIDNPVGFIGEEPAPGDDEPGSALAAPGSSPSAPRLPADPSDRAATLATTGPVRSSPGARKLARRHGLRLEAVPPSGPYGRVVEADVRRAIAALPVVQTQTERVVARPESERPATQPGGPGPRHVVQMTRIRRVTAERTQESVRRSAHVTLTLEADMTQAAALRVQLGGDPELGERGRVGYTELAVKSAARALRRHPDLNAHFEDGQAYRFQDVHVGVAVATAQGLVVAVLRDSDRRPLLDLAAELRDLVDKARAGRLSAAEMSGATFTLTNLGASGVDAFTPIIHQPAAAILGLGAVRERVVAREGAPAVRLTCVLSLSFDHQVVDGVPAAAFLAEVRDGLERPYRLLVPSGEAG